MTENTYTSKKMGIIEVVSDEGLITITTQRLLLRSLNQLSTDDLINAYTPLLANAQNVKLFGEGKPWTALQIKEFITTEQQKWINGNPYGVFAVYNRDNNEFMGSLSTRGVPDEYALVGTGHPNVTEIGYVLDKNFWGKGYGTEIAIASKKYIKHAIAIQQEQGVNDTPNEIVATVHPENIPSKMILKKTLKREADELIFKFNGQPRILFFKPLQKQALETECAKSLEATY